MKQMNDVEILYDAINENPETYQEIVQHQEVMKSLERWPLIAAINQITPLEAPAPRAAVLISRPAKIIRPTPIVAVSETIFIEETLVEKPSIEISEKDNEQISEIAFNSRNTNRAASENISSLFERLKRS
jgi:hypothetical protein